jgi:hypothetical protein
MPSSDPEAIAHVCEQPELCCAERGAVSTPVYRPEEDPWLIEES